jgi:transposase-like protein
MMLSTSSEGLSGAELMSEALKMAKVAKKRPVGRPRIRPERERSKTVPPGLRQQQIIQMRAQPGYTIEEIAHTLGVSNSTVDRELAKPNVRQSLAELRAAIKRAILEQASLNLIEPAFRMAREKAEGGEAKDFDAAMRGINALEKTTMSASGEAQKVEVDQRVVTLNRTELYARIEGLLERGE